MKPNSEYWLSFITWDFGAWKTFWIGAELYNKIKNEDPEVCLISNVPWAICDMHYNSLADFTLLIDYLYRFFTETNNDLEDYEKHWKDIVIVMDEAQLYFPARWFADKDQKERWSKLWVILTQCRKRFLKFWATAQRSKMVDKNFRVLADYIRFYQKDDLNLIITTVKLNRLNVFQCGWWVSDLLWEDGITWETVEDLEESRVYKGLAHHWTDLLDSILKIKNPGWELWDEKNITKYICWLSEDKFHLSYSEFKQKIAREIISSPLISVSNQDWIPLFNYGKKYVDLYGNIITKDEVNSYYID